jgi:predicted transcriptional regulator
LPCIVQFSVKLQEKAKKSCGLCGHEKAVKMRRSRFEIVADIMQACLLPLGKTRIMCKVKLNFTQANDYLSQLTSLGLLSQENGKYKTTSKGRQFISAYNHLGEIIGIPQPSLRGMRVLSPLAPANRRF